MTATTPGHVIIGLDVGTTGVKAVAFGLGSPWRAVVSREYPLLRPAPDQEVQDPAVVVAAVAAALADCVAATGDAEVLGISLSAAMHGLLALDADRRPITPLVTWADGRAGTEALELLHSGQAADLQQQTGTPVHPMTPLSKLMWFARHDPDTWAKARWWVGLKDFLILWLTGTLATELSSASGTGLLDVSTKTWSPLALGICDVDPRRLAEILPTTAVLPLGTAAATSAGLPVGTPVAVGAADGPLGNLGTGAIAPGVAGLSLGTSGAVRLTVDGPHPDRLGTLFCYALADPLWVVGAAVSNGAEVLRWAGRTLIPAAATPAGLDTAALDLAATVAPGSDGLVMLPFLLPERAPLWDPGLAGAYLGLRHDHTAAHLVRAGVEGVCLQMRLILDRLDNLHPISAVRATGGAFRSPLWRNLLAAALDRPLSIVAEAEGTALGAAALGMVALGYTPSLHDATSHLAPPDDREHAPVEPSPALTAAFMQLRSQLPLLLDSLQRAGDPAGPRVLQTGSRVRQDTGG